MTLAQYYRVMGRSRIANFLLLPSRSSVLGGVRSDRDDPRFRYGNEEGNAPERGFTSSALGRVEFCTHMDARRELSNNRG